MLQVIDLISHRADGTSLSERGISFNVAVDEPESLDPPRQAALVPITRLSLAFAPLTHLNRGCGLSLPTDASPISSSSYMSVPCRVGVNET